MTQTTENIASVLERITDAFVALDNNWCYTYMNKKAGEIFSRDPKTIIGKHIWTEFPEGIGQSFYKAYYRAMAEQKYVYLEEYYPPYDKWFENHIYPSPEGLSIYFRDITERKKQELQLKQNEERYHNLVEQALDGIIQINERGEIILVNPAICQMLGYTRAEFLKLNFADTYPESEIHLLAKKISKIKATGSMRLERMMIKKDGTMIPVESFMSKTEDGNFQAIVRDISERKKDEYAIKASEEQYRDLIDNITDLICTHDLDGRILSMNKAAEKTIGFKFDPQRNFNLKTILTTGTKNKYDGYIAEILKNGHVQGLMKIKNNSGEVRIWEFNNSLKKTGDNTPTVIRGYARDVTEQKKAEDVLKEKGNFIESIINSSPDIIYIYDIEEKKNVFINEGMQTNLGYSDDEIKKMGNQVLQLLMHPDDFQFYLNHTYPRYAVVQDKEIIHQEFRMQDKRGNWHSLYCKESIFLRNPDGTPKQIFGITIDITELKKAEKEIKKSEKRFEAMVENNDSIIALLDENFHTIYRSRSAERITGWTDEESQKSGYIELTHPDDREKLNNLMAEIIKNPGKLFPLTVRGKHKNGSYISMEGSVINLLYDENINAIVTNVRDITERIKVEEKIKESELKYRSLIEQANDAIFILDQSLKYIDINPSGCKLTGYSREEFVKLTPADILFEEDLKVLSMSANELKPDKTISHERRIKRKDGKAVEVEINAKVLDDGRIIAFARDITERKKAETSLAESENYLRTILQTEPECVKIIGLKGELISMNPAGLAMIEADNEEQVLGHQMAELVNKKYRAAFKKLAKDVFNGNSGTLEFEITGLKGASRWMETHAVPLKNANRKITSLLGVTRDITQRKKTELELIQSEEKYRLIFFNNPLPMWISNKPNMQLIEVNEAAIKHYGYSRKEFLQLDARKLHTVDDVERFNRFVKENPGKTGGSIGIWRHVKKDKSIMDIDILVYEIQYENKDCYLILANDVTEKIKAEKKLKKTLKEVRELTTHLQTIREEERKRIAREIHDELGQQLTAIKMDVAWIDKKTPRDANDIKKKLKNIITLLDGSNLSIRKILSELRPGILDNYDLLEALEWQGKQFTNSTSIPVFISSAESEIRLAENITTCIFRVYQEALTNIMRYALAKNVFVSLKIINNTVIVSIRDDGKGFDTSSLENKKSFGILGMKERVLSLQGTFELFSAKGKGTTIVISLPGTVLTNIQTNH